MKSFHVTLLTVVATFAVHAAGAVSPTGFEAPAFHPAVLGNGAAAQAGWTGASSPLISTAAPHGGAQHLRLEANGAAGFVQAFSPWQTVAPFTPNVTSFWFRVGPQVSGEIFVATGSSVTGRAWGLTVLSNQLSTLVAANGTYSFISVFTDMYVIPNQYHQIAVDYDPVGRTIRYYLDGVLFKTESGTELSPADRVESVHFDLTQVAGARVDIDDIGSDILPTPAFVSGDANCDGVVNNFDIDYFVQAVIGTGSATVTPTYATLGGTQSCWNLRKLWGDVNHDAGFNNFDIDPFVACILIAPPAGSGCP